MSGPSGLQVESIPSGIYPSRVRQFSVLFFFGAAWSVRPSMSLVGWPLAVGASNPSLFRDPLDTLDTDSLRSSALALLLVVRGTGTFSAGFAVVAAVVLAVFVFLMLLLLLFAAAVIVVVVVAVAARDRRAVGMSWLRAAVRQGGRGRRSYCRRGGRERGSGSEAGRGSGRRRRRSRSARAGKGGGAGGRPAWRRRHGD